MIIDCILKNWIDIYLWLYLKSSNVSSFFSKGELSDLYNNMQPTTYVTSLLYINKELEKNSKCIELWNMTILLIYILITL